MRKVYLIPRTWGLMNIKAAIDLVRAEDSQAHDSLAPYCMGILIETKEDVAGILGLIEWL